MKDASGRCLCGAITFTAQEVNTEIHACHCDMCRRWNGGPALAASVGSVTFTGEEHLTRFDSSAWAERGFCNRCGSNLFYRLKDADHYIVAMGAFDDPSTLKLSGEIFIEEKPSAYDLAGDHSRMTGEEFIASLQQGDK